MNRTIQIPSILTFLLTRFSFFCMSHWKEKKNVDNSEQFIFEIKFHMFSKVQGGWLWTSQNSKISSPDLAHLVNFHPLSEE